MLASLAHTAALSIDALMTRRPYGLEDFKFSLNNGFILWEGRWERTDSCWRIQHYAFNGLLSWPGMRHRFISFKARNIIMLGLSNSGKTSILQRLKHQQLTGKGALVPTTPTIGYNIEWVECNFGSGGCSVWDYGGQFFGLLRNSSRDGIIYDADAIIFALDASNVGGGMEQEMELLHKMLESKQVEADIPLLIFANKQDMLAGGATIARDVADRLGLYDNENNSRFLFRRWHVQECSAMNNEGIQEGWGWLMTTMQGDLG